MHKSIIATLSALISLFVFTTASAVTTYKWVDQEGNPVYSQQPPAEGVQYEKIQTRDPSRHSGNAEPGARTSARESILEDKAKNDKEALVEKEMAKNQETRQKNCELAKKKLEFYQVQRRWKDEKGNVKTLTEEERKAKLEESKQQIKEFCE